MRALLYNSFSSSFANSMLLANQITWKGHWRAWNMTYLASVFTNMSMVADMLVSANSVMLILSPILLGKALLWWNNQCHLIWGSYTCTLAETKLQTNIQFGSEHEIVIWDGALWFWSVIKINYDWLYMAKVLCELHTYTTCYLPERYPKIREIGQITSLQPHFERYQQVWTDQWR